MKALRLDFSAADPASFAAMMALQVTVDRCGLEHGLLELVKIRVSQINACAFCLDMHLNAARKLGESAARLDTLAAWRETRLFSARERAALAWAEALTLLGHPEPVPDAVYEQTSALFSAQELVALSTAVVAINGWNRLCIAFRVQPRGRAAE